MVNEGAFLEVLSQVSHVGKGSEVDLLCEQEALYLGLGHDFLFLVLLNHDVGYTSCGSF